MYAINLNLAGAVITTHFYTFISHENEAMPIHFIIGLKTGTIGAIPCYLVLDCDVWAIKKITLITF